MRSMLTKITAVVAAAFMILGFLAVPAATAQTYPPILPSPTTANVTDAQLLDLINLVNGGADIALSPPTFNADGTVTFTITFGANVDPALVTNIKAEYNPTLYDGKIPASKTLSVTIPCGETLTITYTLINGGNFSESYPVPACAGAVAAVSVPVPNLAFTGSSANLPVALGATLVGMGGLALLAARKRELGQA